MIAKATVRMRRHSIGRGALRERSNAQRYFIGAFFVWFFVAVVLLPILLKRQLASWIFPASVVAMVAFAVTYFSLRGSVRIGKDGLFIDWRDERRFVRFADVEKLRRYTQARATKVYVGINVTLTSGEVVDIPFGQDHLGAGDRVAALVADLTAALAEYRQSEHASDARALDCAGESADAWVTRLRVIGSGASDDARTQAVPLDQLWSTVEDPAALGATRAAAAVALAKTLDEAGRARLRVAASETVSPALRVVLERAAADEDDAALAEALASVATKDREEREPSS
ncbi:MAG: hypothetical protein U0271_10675 [Polyangiaceae bacterium]